jgi:hypothetical protein
MVLSAAHFGQLRIVATAILVVVAVVLTIRQLAGAFTKPLDSGTLLAVGAVLLLLAIAARGKTVASAALILLIVLLTASTNSIAAALLLWTATIFEELWSWQPVWFKIYSQNHLQPTTDHPPPDELEPSEDILQNLVLRRVDDTSQELSGWLRMSVTKGQRTGSLHVAFCPPFAELPAIESEQHSGPACRIQTAQLLHCGVRLDLKLDAVAAKDESVVVRFFARGAVTTSLATPSLIQY